MLSLRLFEYTVSFFSNELAWLPDMPGIRTTMLRKNSIHRQMVPTGPHFKSISTLISAELVEAKLKNR